MTLRRGREHRTTEQGLGAAFAPDFKGIVESQQIERYSYGHLLATVGGLLTMRAQYKEIFKRIPALLIERLIISEQISSNCTFFQQENRALRGRAPIAGNATPSL